MRVRAQTESGDYSFGQGSDNFLVNSPQCVAQLVLTGLKLWQGEWFLDVTAGMPWETEVLGPNPESVYDAAIQNQVLSTQGVTGISNYLSSEDPANRSLQVSFTLETEFGSIDMTFPFRIPRWGYGIGPWGKARYGE